MNLETVRRLREEGLDAVYGDATQRETLKAAGVGRGGQPDPRRGRAWPPAPR